MLLIATDEAGYGPKLGPLVVVGTAWRLPSVPARCEELDCWFAPLRQRCVCNGLTVMVDDSKTIYSASAGLDSLHTVVSASHHWCKRPETTLQQLLPQLAASDLRSIANTPWLQMLSDLPFLTPNYTAELLSGWRSTGVELIDVKARVITAGEFNLACDLGNNKADLLSESTLGLVRDLLSAHGQQASNVAVFCDRHGGRRYYGGILQHLFPDYQLQVVSEAKLESRYRLLESKQEVEVRFTVKGDSFTPVALSSIHAKYLRERFMESFNRYFQLHHEAKTEFRPTAGYPVDADRFLAEIASTIRKNKIDPATLIRAR